MKIKVSILEPLREALFFIKPRALKQFIWIIEDYPRNLPSVLIDPGQLTQVFINLLLNALQSIKDSGEVKIVVFLTPDNCVVVKIYDTGQGIKREDLAHIFDPFFTTKADGTGLGLTITKNILMQNKISISIDSAVGVGTTVTLKMKAHYEI